jgi:hypothetical protein
VFTATFENISVLLVEETGVSEKTTDLSQVPIVNFILNTNIKKQRHNDNQINHENLTHH